MYKIPGFILLIFMLMVNVYAQQDSTKTVANLVIHYSSKSRENPIHKNLKANYNYSDISIIPRYGHFYTSNILIGMGVGYQSESLKSEYQTYVNGDGVNVNSNLILINPFLIYYQDLNNILKLAMEIDAIYGFGELKTDKDDWGETENYKRQSFKAAIRTGIEYNINSIIKTEMSFVILQYYYIEDKPETENLSNGKDEYFGSANFLESIRFGIYYHF